MAKLKKRMRVICFALTLIFTLIVFCGINVPVANAEGYLTGSIKITVLNKGYGVEWLYALKDDYEEKT